MTRKPLLIVVGFDPRPAEAQGFAVARHSIKRQLTVPVPIVGLNLAVLRDRGFYWRPTEKRDGRLWDVISDAPMSTEFAITRFLVPHLFRHGWVLFVDCDVMARTNLMWLFDCADPSKACMVVKHNYEPSQKEKMDKQIQLPYERKNWSSVVLWNCEHPSTRALTVEMVNSKRGLWLHQFTWLDDIEIGELEPEWNHLVGDKPPNPNAKLVHFTNGCPNVDGYQNCEYADEWRNELERWAA